MLIGVMHIKDFKGTLTHKLRFLVFSSINPTWAPDTQAAVIFLISAFSRRYAYTVVQLSSRVLYFGETDILGNFIPETKTLMSESDNFRLREQTLWGIIPPAETDPATRYSSSYRNGF